MTYTHTTLTTEALLTLANTAERNADEVRLLYPEPVGTDSAPLIQAELDAIGEGRGRSCWRRATGRLRPG